MANRTDSLSKNLAENLIKLRTKQGLTQSQLAKKSGVPRSTLTYLESGESNPSLGNLAKVSFALQISVEELISQPQSGSRLIPAKEIPKIRKSKNCVLVEKLLPDPIPGMEIDKITLLPGSRFKGTPHIAQTKEYLHCSEGTVRVYINKKQFVLTQGDVLAFSGDEPHAYENASQQKKASCFSVVVFAPLGL